MNSTKYKHFLMVLIFMVSLWLVPQAQATVANNAAEFTIDPVYPSEQQAGNTGYFSLAVHPASTVPVKVKITNTNQHQAVTYRLKVGNATTNPTGTINYANFTAKKDPTAQYRLTDFIDHATRGQKITVPANSDRTVTVNLRLPAHAFSGIVAGGVYVERLTNGANQQSGNSAKRQFPNPKPLCDDFANFGDRAPARQANCQNAARPSQGAKGPNRRPLA